MTGFGLSALFWFVAVLAAIPATLWLLKRTPLGAAAGGGRGVGGMRSIGALPLSASQKLVTVEVGSGADRRWLVLGVTPGSITTLHAMAPQDEALPPQPMPATPFAQLLARLRRDDHAPR